MKSKITGFIMSVVILLIIIILVCLGIIIYKEITSNESIATDVENFVSTYSTLFEDTKKEENVVTPQIIENTTEIPKTPTTNKTNIDYSKIETDGFFYEQLEPESQTIYKALQANEEEMKTGTATIDLGTTFSDLLATSGGEQKLGEYYQSAVESYLYDNPRIFYISANKLYLNIETTTRGNKKTYKVFINNGSQPNYFSDEYTSQSQVEQAIDMVEKTKDQIISQKTNNTYNNIKMVHDYLINNVEYDSTLAKDNIYNIYGALVNKQSVCEGYAKAFKYLLDEMQIPCVMVIGQATNSKGETENHAWNYVRINNSWYAVDSTWDDPVIIGNGTISNDIKYKYFLRGSTKMNEDHIPNTQFTEEGRNYEYPILSQYDYEN